MLSSGMFLPLLAATIPNPLTPLTIAALLLTLFLVAMYYMFSKLLASPQLEAFAKEEFSQFLFTTLIFGLFMMLYISISGLASAAACGTSRCDHIDLALYSLGIVESAMFNTYISLYSAEFIIGLVSTISFNIPIMVTPAFLVWLQLSSFSGIEPISNGLITLIESMGYLFGLAYARERLVYFFRDVTFTILIPLGFFMRALPFSRRTGSSIIAIAFAGFFAYPLSIVLSHQLIFGGFGEGFGMDVVTPLPPPALCSQNEAYVEASNLEIGEEWEDLIESYSTQDYSSNFFSLILDVLLSALRGVVDLFTEFLPAFFKKYNFDLLSPTFSPFIHAAYFYLIKQIIMHVQLAVFVLISFVLEIIISVAAFRSVSGFLGGEMEIMGLTKVV